MTQKPGDDGLVQTQHEELDRLLDALGVPAKTVKSRLYSARQRLGELLLGWKAS